MDKSTADLSAIYSLQAEAVNFTRLDKEDCIKSVIEPMEATRPLIVVTSNWTTAQNNDSSLIDGWTSGWDGIGGWVWSSGWVCSARQPKVTDKIKLKYCTWSFAETFVDNWTVVSGSQPPVFARVDYCLAGDGADNKERCGLHYSTHVLGIVCLCTLAETLLIFWTWFQNRRNAKGGDSKRHKRTMVTMGDAIHSFLEIPNTDPDQAVDIDPKPGSVRVRTAKWLVQSRVSWGRFVSSRAWAVTFLL